jgi:hypothetical protein
MDILLSWKLKPSKGDLAQEALGQRGGLGCQRKGVCFADLAGEEDSAGYLSGQLQKQMP